MTMDISIYLDELESSRLSPRTIAGYRDDLSRFMDWFTRSRGRPPRDEVIQRTDVEEWLETLHHQGYANATISHRLSALRSYFSWARRAGRTREYPARQIRPPRVRTAARLPPPDSRSIRALKRAASDRIRLADSKGKPGTFTPTAREARRDRAILHLILETRLRVSRLCSLTIHDVPELLGDPSARASGAPSSGLSRSARTALEDWLAARPEGTGDALFIGRYGRGLRARGLQRALDRLAAFSTVSPDHISPDRLRHAQPVADPCVRP